jgi:uncharacterized protein (DUF2236 family)
MTVARADLERALAELQLDVDDERAGLYGPGSATWEIAREMVVFLGGGRAALLQLAHPYVAYAVAHHSKAKGDLLGRFQRTFEHVFAMVFGDVDHAVASARRVHAIHQRVSGPISEPVGPYRSGHVYRANDEEALLWVHATLIDTAVQVFELCVRPMSPREKERHYEESRRFALLFGIPKEVMPRDWAAFVGYMDHMARELDVARPAAEMAEFLLSPPALRPKSLSDWYRTMTAGLLPDRIRVQFGMRFEARERAAFRASIRALGLLRRTLPASLRYLPAYNDALRRIAGKSGRDPIGVWVERWVLHGALGR